MIKDKIVELFKKTMKEDIEIEISIPENKNFGHYSTNVALKLVKKSGKNPMEIAESIKYQVSSIKPSIFEKVEVALPGFVNFWVKPEEIQKEFKEIYKKEGKWGKPSVIRPSSAGWRIRAGKHVHHIKKTVVIDYSGVNIAKPMHVGHLRSTIIGQALYNIFKFSGWKTIGDNHLGDWGKQFGVLIAAYKMANSKGQMVKGPKNLTIDALMDLYVDYIKRMKTDSKLEEVAKMETKKLQNGDKENIKIWKEFYKRTLAELNKVFKLLGIKFDYQLGESFYNPILESVVKDALKKGVAQVSDGAVVIFTDKDKSPLIIQKSDEAYLYGTTDIATVKYRVGKFNPKLILYVVDNSQSLHLDQVFKAVKMLEYVSDEKLVHVKFGLILAEDMKKLSTRGGKHISLLELINEAIAKSKKIVEEKRPDLSKKEKENVAKVIGVSALKYNDLSQNRQSDIAFKWDKMLNLEGNSGPYLQYTYARLRSILRKAGATNYQLPITNYLSEQSELNLILLLEQFPEVISEITKSYYPHHLADYLYKLAKEVNAYYHVVPVLKSEKNIRQARLSLIASIAQTLKTGLNLLGIETLEKM